MDIVKRIDLFRSIRPNKTIHLINKMENPRKIEINPDKFFIIKEDGKYIVKQNITGGNKDDDKIIII